MDIKIALIAGLSIALTGCGMGKALNTYGYFTPVERSEIDVDGYTYRMFDRKDISHLMITPSIFESARSGAIKGATMFTVNISDDKGRFTSVANAYLKKQRPSELCEIKSGEMIFDPQWEFVYLCTAKQVTN